MGREDSDNSVFSTTLSPTLQSVAPSNAPSTRTVVQQSPTPTLAPVTAVVPLPAATSAPTVATSAASAVAAPLEDVTIASRNTVQGPTAAASSGGSSSSFGASLALASNDGSVMAVGAPDANGRTGQVHIYELSSVNGVSSNNNSSSSQEDWVQRDVLQGDLAQDSFGTAVAMNGDGSIVAIAAPGSQVRAGSVHVFYYNAANSTYEPLANVVTGTLAASYSGSALALSQDGRRMAVGAPYYSGVNGLRLHGQVTVYELSSDNTVWNVMGQVLSGNGELDLLGSAVTMSENGLELAASAPRSRSTGGYVRVWSWNKLLQQWNVSAPDITNTYEPSLSSDRFGHSISLYSNVHASPAGVGFVVQRRLAIGIPWKAVSDQPRAGMTAVYELETTSSEPPLESTDSNVMQQQQGSGIGWKQLGSTIVQENPSGDDEAGSAVTMLDGSHLLVGIPGANNRRGNVQLYRFLPSSSSSTPDEESTNGIWQQHPTVLQGLAPGDDFGVSLASQRQGGQETDSWSFAVGAISGGDDNAGYVASYHSTLPGSATEN